MFWAFATVFINEDVHSNVHQTSLETSSDKSAILKCNLILLKNHKR